MTCLGHGHCPPRRSRRMSYRSAYPVVAVGQDQEGKVALECAVEVVSQFPFEVIYGMISLCDSG
jgi:hypothetical protein